MRRFSEVLREVGVEGHSSTGGSVYLEGWDKQLISIMGLCKLF